MSLLIKGGITRLSELTIDADKNWQVKGITNLKEVAAAMAKGDLSVRSNLVLVRFAPGPIGHVLTSAGAGHLPTWLPVPGPLEMYLPAWIYLSHAEAIVPADQTHNENAPITSEHEQAYLDAPADYIKRLTPAILCPDAQAIVAADQSHNENVPIGTDLSILVDGFVEETAAAAQTDKTAEARSAAANDLNLCPMTPIALDKVYIGSNYPFWRVWMNYGTAGVGNWTNVCYYWNGAWVVCVGEDDQTSSFLAAAGIKRIDHVPQGDWALSVIQGMNLYWMMIRTDAYVNQVTAPLGTQVWVSIA